MAGLADRGNILPSRLWVKVRIDLRKASMATTGQECRRRLEKIAEGLRKVGQGPAGETVLRDVEDFLTFIEIATGLDETS